MNSHMDYDRVENMLKRLREVVTRIQALKERDRLHVKVLHLKDERVKNEISENLRQLEQQLKDQISASESAVLKAVSMLEEQTESTTRSIDDGDE